MMLRHVSNPPVAIQIGADVFAGVLADLFCDTLSALTLQPLLDHLSSQRGGRSDPLRGLTFGLGMQVRRHDRQARELAHGVQRDRWRRGLRQLSGHGHVELVQDLRTGDESYRRIGQQGEGPSALGARRPVERVDRYVRVHERGHRERSS